MLKVENVLRNEKGENVLNDYFESIIIKGNFILVQKNGFKGLFNAENFNKILECEWDKIVFDWNYILAYRNSQVAVFEQNGNKILECEWDKVIIYEKGLLAIKNGMQGFFKYNGTPILNCVWRRIEPYSEVILAYRGKGAKRIIYDYDGNIKKQQ